MKKVCINPKQAAEILNIGERQAQRIFRDIRFVNNKKKRQFITIKEFCTYTGIDEELLDL